MKMSKCNGPKGVDPGRIPVHSTKEEYQKHMDAYCRFCHSYQYEELCKCGKRHFLETQEDIYPEYYADVYLKCDCGQYVKFELPVN
jgi:hypothetical protein